MRRFWLIGLMAAAWLAGSWAQADIVVPPSTTTVTLTGEAAATLVRDDFGQYSGPANVSCKHNPQTGESVCVLQLTRE